MSATYDETLATDKDKIRSLLGDTNVSPASNALFTDEHIAAVLTIQGTIKAAVAYLADELIAQSAQEPVKIIVTDGGVSISVDYSKRIPLWQELASKSRTDSGGSLTFVTATYGADTTDEYARPPEYWP